MTLYWKPWFEMGITDLRARKVGHLQPVRAFLEISGTKQRKVWMEHLDGVATQHRGGTQILEAHTQCKSIIVNKYWTISTTRNSSWSLINHKKPCAINMDKRGDIPICSGSPRCWEPLRSLGLWRHRQCGAANGDDHGRGDPGAAVIGKLAWEMPKPFFKVLVFSLQFRYVHGYMMGNIWIIWIIW